MKSIAIILLALIIVACLYGGDRAKSVRVRTSIATAARRVESQ